MSKMLLLEELKVSFQMWAMRNAHSHDVVLFRLPRAGFRFFLSAPGMYLALQLSSYSRRPSKWVYEMSDQWIKYAKAWSGAEGHFLQSRLAAGDKGKWEVTDDYDHARDVLPESMFSTSMLVQNLVRWTSMTPRTSDPGNTGNNPF